MPLAAATFDAGAGVFTGTGVSTVSTGVVFVTGAGVVNGTGVPNAAAGGDGEIVTDVVDVAVALVGFVVDGVAVVEAISTGD